MMMGIGKGVYGQELWSKSHAQLRWRWNPGGPPFTTYKLSTAGPGGVVLWLGNRRILGAEYNARGYERG